MIVFLVWLWISNNSILLGAEFDAELARERSIQAGHPADQEPYLPLRKQAVGAQAVERRDVERDHLRRRIGPPVSRGSTSASQSHLGLGHDQHPGFVA